MRRPNSIILLALAVIGLASGCADTSGPGAAAVPSEPEAAPGPTAASTATTILTEPAPTSSTTITTTSTVGIERAGQPRPDWLGTRVLPLEPGASVADAQPTPPELVDRRLWTEDVLPPPVDDRFVAEILQPPPDDVLARSTWSEECPVGPEELAYATVSFVGFDGLFHTGELLTLADDVDAMVEVFAALHEMRFPIEQMTVTTQEEFDAAPTGDGNNTSSFVCRAVVNARSWSRHAHGAAIDLNPFHNPYVKGDTVIPELATAYADRTEVRPGMVTEEIVERFAAMGWSWGGNWSTAKDWMHFSDDGN